MTWSTIARDNATGQFGIAVATRFFAVGALVPDTAAGIGGIATQALVNPYYGIDGVRLLREGHAPRDVVETLIAADAGHASRQLHIMDASGKIAAYTGKDCVDWCGHIEGNGFSVAGNMLAGAQVLDDTAKAYLANQSLPLARRLIAAMRSGEAAGGDKRGRQSAALLIYGEEEWSDLDLRIDDHTDLLLELERLEAVSRERWVHFREISAEPREWQGSPIAGLSMRASVIRAGWQGAGRGHDLTTRDTSVISAFPDDRQHRCRRCGLGDGYSRKFGDD